MLGSGCVPKCVGLGGVPQPKGVLGCMPNTSWVCLAQQGWVCYAQYGGVHPCLVCGLRILLEPMLLRYFLCFYRFLLFYVGICLPHLFFDSSYVFKKVRLFYLYVLLLYLIAAVHVMPTISYHKLAFIIKKKMIYK